MEPVLKTPYVFFFGPEDKLVYIYLNTDAEELQQLDGIEWSRIAGAAFSMVERRVGVFFKAHPHQYSYVFHVKNEHIRLFRVIARMMS
jgi:hypothetical protein